MSRRDSVLWCAEAKEVQVTTAGGVKGCRIIFAGGGTGGHVVPAVATAEALAELEPDADCLFLGTERESEEALEEILKGYRVLRIPAVQCRSVAQRLRFPFDFLGAADRAVSVYRSVRPRVVVGLGGYSCVVPVLIAKALNVPTMLFESNAIPGAAVRALAPLADCVQVQWEVAAERLHAKRCLVTGNPVRKAILEADRAAALRRLGLSEGRCTMLVMGGSQGALSVNRVLLRALKKLAVEAGVLQVLHLAGPAHIRAVRGSEVPGGIIYRAVGFLPNMGDAYAVADFALARAGGGTVAELAAAGVPSVLVPYPYARDKHQDANARVLADAGAAVSVDQDHLNADLLAAIIRDLVEMPDLRSRMAKKARKLARPDAAKVVAGEILRLSRRGPASRRTQSGEIVSPHDLSLAA